jgi:hypothetical protein
VSVWRFVSLDKFAVGIGLLENKDIDLTVMLVYGENGTLMEKLLKK